MRIEEILYVNAQLEFLYEPITWRSASTYSDSLNGQSDNYDNRDWNFWGDRWVNGCEVFRALNNNIKWYCWLRLAVERQLSTLLTEEQDVVARGKLLRSRGTATEIELNNLRNALGLARDRQDELRYRFALLQDRINVVGDSRVINAELVRFSSAQKISGVTGRYRAPMSVAKIKEMLIKRLIDNQFILQSVGYKIPLALCRDITYCDNQISSKSDTENREFVVLHNSDSSSSSSSDSDSARQRSLSGEGGEGEQGENETIVFGATVAGNAIVEEKTIVEQKTTVAQKTTVVSRLPVDMTMENYATVELCASVKTPINTYYMYYKYNKDHTDNKYNNDDKYNTDHTDNKYSNDNKYKQYKCACHQGLITLDDLPLLRSRAEVEILCEIIRSGEIVISKEGIDKQRKLLQGVETCGKF